MILRLDGKSPTTTFTSSPDLSHLITVSVWEAWAMQAGGSLHLVLKVFDWLIGMCLFLKCCTLVNEPWIRAQRHGSRLTEQVAGQQEVLLLNLLYCKSALDIPWQRSLICTNMSVEDSGEKSSHLSKGTLNWSSGRQEQHTGPLYELRRKFFFLFCFIDTTYLQNQMKTKQIYKLSRLTSQRFDKCIHFIPDYSQTSLYSTAFAFLKELCQNKSVVNENLNVNVLKAQFNLDIKILLLLPVCFN